MRLGSWLAFGMLLFVFFNRLVSLVLVLTLMTGVSSVAGAQNANEPTLNAVKPLAYAGFGLTSSVADFQKAYATSKQWTADRGTFSIWVSATEMRDGIWYIQLRRDRNNENEELRLSFEVPTDLRKSVVGRSCEDILKSLITLYGPPMREPKPWYEESARHAPKIWLDAKSELIFDCAEYAIIMRRPGPSYWNR